MADNFLKKIELKFKKVMENFINGNIPPDLFTIDKQINPKKIKKILLLRQDRIGDLLISSSFVRNLKLLIPEAQIDILLSNKNIGAIYAIKKYINHTYIYDKRLSSIFKLSKEMNNHNYDLVIDLFDNPSSTSSIFLKLLKNTYKIGFDKKNRNSYNLVIPLPDKKSTHPVDRLFQFFSIFGINPNELNKDLEYDISDIQMNENSSNKNKLAINIAGSTRSKFWGINNNIELIKLINSKFPEIKINLFGTKDYEIELNEISKSTKVEIAKYTKSFHEFALDILKNDIIITPDTSVVHLAASTKTPCIIFYEGNDFAMPWTPYNSPFKMITTKNESIQSITPEMAFKAFEELYLGE